MRTRTKTSGGDSFCTPAIVSLLGLCACGCATGLGPKALRGERPDWNQQIVRSTDSEMLLNVVRLRYNDSPLFLELGAVVAQYSYDASLSAGAQLQAGANNGTLGTTLGYSEHPTVTYTPLTGEDFAERMLAPIPLDSLMLFEQAGWSAERLLLVAVQRVNDVYNARSATGPTPVRAPDYETFGDFALRFERLRLAGLVGVDWEKKERETDPPGRDPSSGSARRRTPAVHWPKTLRSSGANLAWNPVGMTSNSRLSRSAGSPMRWAFAAVPCSAFCISFRKACNCPPTTSVRGLAHEPKTTAGKPLTGPR